MALKVLWIIFLTPLFSSLLILCFCLNRPKAAGRFATASMLFAFALSLILLLRVPHGGHSLESSMIWMSLGKVPLELGILLNGLSVLMLLIVTGVGSLIFLYSISYMEHEEGYGRYFAWLSFFAFSMLGIVVSNNLIQTFIFWELVGLSSYLLIGFWYQKPEAATAAKKAFLTTRVGDVGMLIGIMLLFSIFSRYNLGTFNFLLIAERLPDVFIYPITMTALALLLFMGVAGKSAQLPLHVWLPDAMEGPTPVSALIHAATMVAAGIFLLARLFFLFSMSPQALHLIAWTGGLTALSAGTMALVQNDIKKILAYSTLSQLGYMAMAVGLRNPEAGMFHLTTHAFFKALLFLGAGSLIHGLHTQNIWDMYAPEGLFKQMPVTSWTFLAGTLALMGIPPLSGFFSKEQILVTARYASDYLFWISSATVFFTAFYMGRLFTVVFLNKKIPEHSYLKHEVHEPGLPMTIPLVLLAIFSIVAGYFPIGHLLSEHTRHMHASYKLTLFSVGLAAAGFLAAFALYYGRKKAVLTHAGLLSLPQKILNQKYFFDDFYDAVVIKGILQNLARLSDGFERFVVVEGAVNNTARLTRVMGHLLRKFQTGVLQFYGLLFAAGLTLVLYFFILAGKS